MNRILNILLVVILLAMAPAYSAFAQNAKESYENGLSLMKKGNYEGAIKCFRSSMIANKSPDNVKKCKAQITKCQKAMTRKSEPANQPSTPVVNTTLKLSTSILPVDAETTETATHEIEVTTYPKSSKWTAEMVNKPQWVKLSRTNDNTIGLQFQPNEKTIARQATLKVSYGSDTKTVRVFQKGKKVELAAEKYEKKFSKKKSETANIEITCNSDTTYSNSYNWCVAYSPEWCKAEQTSKQITLTLEPIVKNSPLWKSGRQDDIILKSQDVEFKIRIIQK